MFMKKFKINLILFFMMLCTSFSEVHAQEGSLMLYGSLTYKENNNSGSSFGANPIGLGYFFNDHVVAGMNFAFDQEKNGLGNLTDSRYEVGPFYSDSWKIGDYFYIIAQVDAHYVWGNAMMNTTSAYGYDGYLARAYPIVAVSLGHGWALKQNFANSLLKVPLEMIARRPKITPLWLVSTDLLWELEYQKIFL